MSTSVHIYFVNRNINHVLKVIFSQYLVKLVILLEKTLQLHFISVFIVYIFFSRLAESI